MRTFINILSVLYIVIIVSGCHNPKTNNDKVTAKEDTVLIADSAIMKVKPTYINDYFNQNSPGLKPEPFNSNLLLNNEQNGGYVFSKSGDQVFFFSTNHRGKYCIMHSDYKDGNWSKPKRINKTETTNEVHPFFSNDDKKVFYGSDKRIHTNEKVPYMNIWFIEKKDSTWSEPSPLPPVINTGYENCGSFDSDTILYFRRVSKSTRGDIFISELKDGKFQSPKKLPANINTAYDESHPAISPDGSYLIFSSKRPGGYSPKKDNLWISFKNDSGEWSDPLNMGKEINNGRNISCATISPDGKFIVYIKIDNEVSQSYWVSSKILDNLKP